MKDIIVTKNIDSLTEKAADIFLQQVTESVLENDRCTVALSGGTTPKGLFALLTDENAPFREKMPWDKIHFFWGDERHVPLDHDDSNFLMAQKNLLDKAPVPEVNIHPVPAGYSNAKKSAIEYEKHLQQFFNLADGEFPMFDFILLGLGEDAHTASLFPGVAAIHETSRLVLSPWVDKLNTFRITFTPPVLNNARFVLLLASGLKKADSVNNVLYRTYDPDKYPAQIVKPGSGKLVWLMDEAAGVHFK